MIILGIDPGFDRMGCAILKKEKGKEILLFSDCLLSVRGEEIEKRIFSLATQLEKIIKKYKPDVVALEQVFFAKNIKTASQVSQASGAVIYLAGKFGIPALEISPLQVKMCTVGYGKAEKRQVQIMVKSILKMEKSPKYDDEMDAIAVALACSSKLSTAAIKGLDKQFLS